MYHFVLEETRVSAAFRDFQLSDGDNLRVLMLNWTYFLRHWWCYGGSCPKSTLLLNHRSRSISFHGVSEYDPPIIRHSTGFYRIGKMIRCGKRLDPDTIQILARVTASEQSLSKPKCTYKGAWNWISAISFSEW